MVTSSRALSQVTHETVTHDAKGGSLSVWWDPGRTALVSEPTAYPGVTPSRPFLPTLSPTLIPFPALVSGEGRRASESESAPFFLALHPSLGLRLFDPGFVMNSRFLETRLDL